MKRAFRFVAALVGGFVALYLFFLLTASSILNAIASATPLAVDPWVRHSVAVVPALVGAGLYAVQYDQGRRSLERLWTFVIAGHLLTYAVLYPYFHVVHARRGFDQLLAAPAGSAAYHVVGYSLLFLAILCAYGLVYRDAYGVAKRRFAV